MTEENKLRAAFAMFDKDNSGTISAEEIRQVLCFGSANALSVEAVDAIIKQVDENGDGDIQFDEFVTMMQGLEQAQAEVGQANPAAPQ